MVNYTTIPLALALAHIGKRNTPTTTCKSLMEAAMLLQLDDMTRDHSKPDVHTHRFDQTAETNSETQPNMLLLFVEMKYNIALFYVKMGVDGNSYGGNAMTCKAIEHFEELLARLDAFVKHLLNDEEEHQHLDNLEEFTSIITSFQT